MDWYEGDKVVRLLLLSPHCMNITALIPGGLGLVCGQSACSLCVRSPTVDKHGHEENWELYIGRSCECKCEEFCFSLWCPQINSWLIQGVAGLSPWGNWDRLQNHSDTECRRAGHKRWVNGWSTCLNKNIGVIINGSANRTELSSLSTTMVSELCPRTLIATCSSFHISHSTLAGLVPERWWETVGMSGVWLLLSSACFLPTDSTAFTMWSRC